MTAQEAEAIIGEALEQIENHPRRNLRVPHGFAVEAIEVEEQRNPFAPSLRHWRVAATLRVPVIYSYTTARQAHLPAQRHNLEALRAWIEGDVDALPHHVVLTGWEVAPDEDPEPAEGTSWQVRAVFEAH